MNMALAIPNTANEPQFAESPVTVEKVSFATLGERTDLSADQLADIVIEGVKKIRSYLPYIIRLKECFDAGDRDHANKLKTPIKGCHSWKEFCAVHLDRAPQTIGEAIREATKQTYQAEITKPKCVAIPSICHDCRESFPSRSRLKEHGRTVHGVSSSEISKFLRRATGEPDPIILPVDSQPQECSPPTQTPLKDSEIVSQLQDHEKAANDLSSCLKANGFDIEVSRSTSDGKFNVVWHDATADEILERFKA